MKVDNLKQYEEICDVTDYEKRFSVLLHQRYSISNGRKDNVDFKKDVLPHPK